MVGFLFMLVFVWKIRWISPVSPFTLFRHWMSEPFLLLCWDVDLHRSWFLKKRTNITNSTMFKPHFASDSTEGTDNDSSRSFSCFLVRACSQTGCSYPDPIADNSLAVLYVKYDQFFFDLSGRRLSVYLFDY